MHVFLDESGDLGWNFEHPFREGGSSRFLTLAFLVVDESTHKYPRRLIKKFREHYCMRVSREIKGSNLSPRQLLHFANKVEQLLNAHDEIQLRAITVMKENVRSHIRKDSNKLYNFMINLCLLELIKSEPVVYFTPDPRSIKVSSGDSMIDYLQTQLWFEKGVETSLIELPHESHTNLNLQFVDVVSHIVWSHYEDCKSEPYKIISPRLHCKNLFFR